MPLTGRRPRVPALVRLTCEAGEAPETVRGETRPDRQAARQAPMSEDRRTTLTSSDETGRRLRIALVAPPMKAVPPIGYGGTERVVASLAEGLTTRGHDVTVFASGDSETAGHLEPILDQSLWDTGYRGDVAAYMQLAAGLAWSQADRFDVIHSHLESHGFLLARYCATPVLSTLHGRLDYAGMPELLAAFRDIPLVSISTNQRRWLPDQNWVATIHHGLPLAGMPHRRRPGEYLALVGRVSPEKGISEAIELARESGMRLRMAAKAYEPGERALFDSVVRPAVDDGTVDFLGELDADQRDPMIAGAFATVMLGSWPEPFGLVAIESLATGTPVIGRRSGALPEIVQDGVDGFLVDDLMEAKLALRRIRDLDRVEIRRRALSRFSVDRMARDYEEVYARLAERRSARPRSEGSTIAARPVDRWLNGARRDRNGSDAAAASSGGGSRG